MEFAEYLDNIPALHFWNGAWQGGGFTREHLVPLHRFLTTQGLRVFAETGAGNSTITFLLTQPTKVISIAPDAGLFGRIEAYCAEHGIDAAPLQKIVGPSERELPKLAEQLKQQVDFVLIDGCHGWPHVFLDFFYLADMVRRDGYVMVDDVGLHSVSELVNLLREQPGYELALDLGKALVFKRTQVEPAYEWHRQPYIARMSRRRSQWITALRRRLKI
jgi:hypothetical protein